MVLIISCGTFLTHIWVISSTFIFWHVHSFRQLDFQISTFLFSLSCHVFTYCVFNCTLLILYSFAFLAQIYPVSYSSSICFVCIPYSRSHSLCLFSYISWDSLYFNLYILYCSDFSTFSYAFIFVFSLHLFTQISIFSSFYTVKSFSLNLQLWIHYRM